MEREEVGRERGEGGEGKGDGRCRGGAGEARGRGGRGEGEVEGRQRGEGGGREGEARGAEGRWMVSILTISIYINSPINTYHNMSTYVTTLPHTLHTVMPCTVQSNLARQTISRMTVWKGNLCHTKIFANGRLVIYVQTHYSMHLCAGCEKYKTSTN